MIANYDPNRPNDVLISWYCRTSCYPTNPNPRIPIIYQPLKRFRYQLWHLYFTIPKQDLVQRNRTLVINRSKSACQGHLVLIITTMTVFNRHGDQLPPKLIWLTSQPFELPTRTVSSKYRTSFPSLQHSLFQTFMQDRENLSVTKPFILLIHWLNQNHLKPYESGSSSIYVTMDSFIPNCDTFLPLFLEWID